MSTLFVLVCASDDSGVAEFCDKALFVKPLIRNVAGVCRVSLCVVDVPIDIYNIYNVCIITMYVLLFQPTVLCFLFHFPSRQLRFKNAKIWSKSCPSLFSPSPKHFSHTLMLALILWTLVRLRHVFVRVVRRACCE